MSARRALLERLFDHAPLFPPASLPLEAALAEDDRARVSEHAWLLGRFVCPASLLGELGGNGRRPLSVVADAPFAQDGHEIEAVEARGVPETGVAEVYVEDVSLDEVAARGCRAKIRCGGARVPTAEELAAFVRGCRDRGLVFKATAGLHHAYPTPAREHGFLNLLAAAAFGDEEEALRAQPGSFELDEDAFRWGERTTSAEDLARVRATLFHSIGSCSFFEPIGELRSLGLLA